MGALVAVAFYLFVPFGIFASRSFQPDPLMVMAIVWATVAIVRHHESPAPGRLLIAGIAAGLAAFVKPVSLFFTTGAYVGLAASGKEPIRSVLSRQSLVFLLLSLLPVAVYLGYGTYVAGFLTGQSEGRILPRLLASAFFWAGWLFQIRYAIGLVALVGAALGLVLVSGERETVGWI